MENNEFRWMDVLAIAMLVFSHPNLVENLEQSAHNDVSTDNDQRAKRLLAELGIKFDEHNNVILSDELKGAKNHGNV